MIAETAWRQLRRGARGGPGARGIEQRALDERMQLLRKFSKSAQSGKQLRTIENERRRPKGERLPPARLLSRGIAAVVQQVMMNIDLHRTGAGAGAAERRRTGKVLPVLQSAEVRRDDGTDRALISR